MDGFRDVAFYYCGTAFLFCSGNHCFRQAESRFAGSILFNFQLANRGHVSIPEEAVAIAAALAGIAAIKSIKDGEIDYQKGVVVSGGFGSVQLDEKDTFVGDKNGIKAGTNLFGNVAQSPSPSISIDMAPLVNEMQAVKAVFRWC